MKKILCFLSAVLMMAGIVVLSGVQSGEVWAEKCPEGVFLGFKAWYDGLECGGDPDNPSPTPDITDSDSDDVAEEKLRKFVWTIILNIAFDLFVAVGVIAVGYVIFGGYSFLTAGGEPSKVAKAKKVLLTAVIGILVSLSARMIVNVITGAVGEGPLNTPNSVLNGAFRLAFTIVGFVATGFVIYGGFTYTTANGNPQRANKGKTILTYSIIGLLVVLLSYAIVEFVIGGME